MERSSLRSLHFKRRGGPAPAKTPSTVAVKETTDFRRSYVSLQVHMADHTLGHYSTLPPRAASHLCQYHLRVNAHYRARSAARPGSWATTARPHGPKPPASLALGGFGVTQQHCALSGGEDRRFGTVAEQLRVHVPITGTGQWAGIGQAMGDGVGQHGSLLKRGRPAQRGWQAVNGKEQASNLRRMPYAGEASASAGRCRAGASAQAAEQVRLHVAAMTEHLDHPRVSVALQRAAVPGAPALALVVVPDSSPRHAAVLVTLGNGHEAAAPLDRHLDLDMPGVMRGISQPDGAGLERRRPERVQDIRD